MLLRLILKIHFKYQFNSLSNNVLFYINKEILWQKQIDMNANLKKKMIFTLFQLNY